MSIQESWANSQNGLKSHRKAQRFWEGKVSKERLFPGSEGVFRINPSESVFSLFFWDPKACQTTDDLSHPPLLPIWSQIWAEVRKEGTEKEAGRAGWMRLGLGQKGLVLFFCFAFPLQLIKHEYSYGGQNRLSWLTLATNPTVCLVVFSPTLVRNTGQYYN